MKQPKILFFIEGAVPTAQQSLIALQLGVPVQYRNADWAQDGVPEPCDGVIGEVPALYEDFPDADEVAEAYREALKSQLDAMANEIGGQAYVPRRGLGRAQDAIPELDADGNPVVKQPEEKPNTGPAPTSGGWQGNK